MSEYREGCVKAKAVRAGIIEQSPVGGKKRQSRNVVVECRYLGPPVRDDRNWRKWGAYASEGVAQQTIAQLARKYHWNEFRVRP